jgi:hypothetical protein
MHYLALCVVLVLRGAVALEVEIEPDTSSRSLPQRLRSGYAAADPDNDSDKTIFVDWARQALERETKARPVGQDTLLQKLIRLQAVNCTRTDVADIVAGKPSAWLLPGWEIVGTYEKQNAKAQILKGEHDGRSVCLMKFCQSNDVMDWLDNIQLTPVVSGLKLYPRVRVSEMCIHGT